MADKLTKILQSLAGKRSSKNQTTKLYRSSDNFFNAKAFLLPVREGHDLKVILNEGQALGFGINIGDKVELLKNN
ncbi:MAG: hypothetical protein LBI53_01745 [Candidatus Peribacteria bacterium]|jgi:hypothetical protein|nr:hypothetical protein [Candidatus Peribacteria bacterium]